MIVNILILMLTYKTSLASCHGQRMIFQSSFVELISKKRIYAQRDEN